MSEFSPLPRHVGLIMDGNGRWAKKRLQPRSFGHSAGMKRMIKIAERAKELGIGYLTVYALSTENLTNRPKEEIDQLFNLLRKYFTHNVKELYKRRARVNVIGDLSPLPDDIKKLLEDGQKNSPQDAEFTLTFAINYGSRAEILHAVKAIADSGMEVTEENFASFTYTHGLPDPDLIIRTGGEVRLSNFLLWQAAYAELYFTPVLFPDFSRKEFDKALLEYAKRNRRFGGV